MADTEEQFQQHIHVFRGIAIILIACAHTVPSLDWSNHWVLGKVIDTLANESSIFFFFIAGYWLILPLLLVSTYLGRDKPLGLLDKALYLLPVYLLGWSHPPYWKMPLKVSLVMLLTWLLWRYHGVFGNKLNYIAEVSFGIFFIHAYFISAIKVLVVYATSGRFYNGEGSEDIVGNALTFSLYVAMVLTASVALIWLTRKLLGKYSRMVIGA